MRTPLPAPWTNPDVFAPIRADRPAGHIPGSSAAMILAARRHLACVARTAHPLERADLLARVAYFRRLAARQIEVERGWVVLERAA